MLNTSRSLSTENEHAYATMSYGDNYTYAKTCSGERDSALGISLEDEHSRAETFSDGGDSNAGTSSDEENSATGTSSNKDDSKTKKSSHQDCETSADSTSVQYCLSSTGSSAGEEDAKVSSRSLSELM